MVSEFLSLFLVVVVFFYLFRCVNQTRRCVAFNNDVDGLSNFSVKIFGWSLNAPLGSALRDIPKNGCEDVLWKYFVSRPI